MPISIVTPPGDATDLIPLQMFKLHQRISNTVEDDLITSIYLPTAVQYLDAGADGGGYLNRSILPRTYQMTHRGWGTSADRHTRNLRGLRVPYSPIIAIESITYTGDDGLQQTLSPSDYALGGVDGDLILSTSDDGFPSLRTRSKDVVVTYRAGYADADSVPAPIKNAILLLAGHLYRNREATLVDARQRLVNHALQWGVEALCGMYRLPHEVD